MPESSVALGTAVGGQQVRNLLVTTLINNIPTQVLMQVIALADQEGNLLKLAPWDAPLEILMDIRREMMINNELLVLGLNLTVDIEKEYRQDKAFDIRL